MGIIARDRVRTRLISFKTLSVSHCVFGRAVLEFSAPVGILYYRWR